MLAFATILLAVAVTASDNSEESSELDNQSTELVKSLRRQLMHHNDDYSSEDNSNTDELYVRADQKLNTRKETTRKPQNNIENDKQNANYDKMIQNQHIKTKLSEKNFYMGKAGNFEDKDFESNISYDTDEKPKKEAEHHISKKDLLYYMDEEKIVKAQPPKTNRNKKKLSRNDDNVSTVKYKMLKVKRPNRRSGQHRYIQEENKDGVAIISIDKAPFPEFRLPRSRRQYKHDIGEDITDDEEISPPPVDTNDPEAVAVTEQEVTEVTATLGSFTQ